MKNNNQYKEEIEKLGNTSYDFQMANFLDEVQLEDIRKAFASLEKRVRSEEREKAVEILNKLEEMPIDYIVKKYGSYELAFMQALTQSNP